MKTYYFVIIYPKDIKNPFGFIKLKGVSTLDATDAAYGEAVLQGEDPTLVEIKEEEVQDWLEFIVAADDFLKERANGNNC